MDADTAAALLLDRSARQLVATAASGLEEEVRPGVRSPRPQTCRERRPLRVARCRLIGGTGTLGCDSVRWDTSQRLGRIAQR
jgi:hypothetical protein